MVTEYVCLTGRFAPFCKGHLHLVEAQVAVGHKVVVLVTDAQAALSSRLPWTAEDRETMIKEALAHLGEDVVTLTVDDHPDDEKAWLKRFNDIFGALHPHTAASFKQLSLEGVHPGESEMRTAWFRGDNGRLREGVPSSVCQALKRLRKTPQFDRLAEEFRYIEAYKASWAAAPFPPILVTVDTVIVHADPQGVDHVLLVRRRGLPGKGLYALPGGFVEPNDTLLASAIRELREETGLDLSNETGGAGFKARHVFDKPDRSARGRTITHAFHFTFPAGPLPDVEGRDDAVEARWIAVNDLAQMRGQMFEDHGDILRWFLKY